MTDTSVHTPVLMKEVLEGLAPQEGDTILDATLGGGGHAVALCGGADITLVALDADKRALTRGQEAFEKSSHSCVVHFVEENFRNVPSALDSLGIERINGALFDLGMSSDQLEHSGRGFSFMRDEPLLMTFSEDPPADAPTAETVVNEWTEENIANILYGFGDEHFSRKIARGIVGARQQRRIKTTGQLVQIIEESVPWWYRKRKTHCATKTFQALRIAVNDELGAITSGIEGAFKYLAPKGRIAVITFHSVEDRHVKHLFKDIVTRGATLITPSPIHPTHTEVKKNPRARSALLRIIERIA